MKNRMWIAAVLAGAMLPLAVRAEVDKKTERTWKAKCASCHGVDGKGQTDQGQKMKIGDLAKTAKTDAEIKTAIENGVKKDGAEMEGYKDKLEGAQIDQLVAFVHTLK